MYLKIIDNLGNIKMYEGKEIYFYRYESQFGSDPITEEVTDSDEWYLVLSIEIDGKTLKPIQTNQRVTKWSSEIESVLNGRVVEEKCSKCEYTCDPSVKQSRVFIMNDDGNTIEKIM